MKSGRENGAAGWRVAATMVRRFALVVLLALGSTASARVISEHEAGDFDSVAIGCRKQPVKSAAALRLRVIGHSIHDNGLHVDLQATNVGRSEITLPTHNVEGRYWTADLYSRSPEPISYCGGVSILEDDGFELGVLQPADVATLGPGQSLVIKDLYVAPFWPYLSEPDYDARRFRVYYTGAYSFTTHVPHQRLAEFSPALKTANDLHCALYAGSAATKIVALDPRALSRPSN